MLVGARHGLTAGSGSVESAIEQGGYCMVRRARPRLLALVLLVLIVGCATPRSADRTERPAPAPGGAVHSRMTAAIIADPFTLSATMNTASTGGQPGVEEMQRLIHVGLAARDDKLALQPILGDAVPTVENGLWKVLPDGRMEVTHRIKPNARWHDGTALTSGDLVFTVQVGQDRDLPLFRSRAFDALEAVEAPDPATVVVRWREPYIWADTMFTPDLAMPLPRHLLEAPYTADKAQFVDLPFWTEGFVGTGPFKVQEWARGSHILLRANDAYALGRPRIDEIEVKFIPDSNALIANVLAGTVELTMGRGLSVDSGAELRDQFKNGTVALELENWVALYPQSLTPNPAIVGNPEFRKALLYAMDRQEMVQSIQHGLVPIADAIFSPNDPVYRDIEPAIVRYEFDARRAIDMITRLGIARGADGSFALPQLEIRAAGTAGDSSNKGMLVIADYWKRIGLASETVQIPNQRRRDVEYRATFPAFTIQRQPNGEEGMLRYHSREAAVPENNWFGDNKARYVNPEMDSLLDRYFVTIARAERAQIGRQIVQHMTTQVVPLPLFYDANAVVLGKRLSNVIPAQVGWNAHEWTAQ
jgi:peptide/nickel transport system substrate-binding protein